MKKIKQFLKLFRNKDFRKAAIIIIILIIAVSGYLYYQTTTGRILIDNSIVKAPITVISPDTPDKIYDSYVTEGQIVKKGDSLALVGSQVLRAYTNGLIVSVNNQKGSLASAQTPVISMIDLSAMRIDGTIDENKGLNNIKVGQVASFTVDALPGKTFWGYVDEVSPSAKQTQLAFSISSERPTQQFDVFVKYNFYQYPEIKNGMSAKITVYTK